MYKNASISWEKLSSMDTSCAYEILLMQAGWLVLEGHTCKMAPVSSWLNHNRNISGCGS